MAGESGEVVTVDPPDKLRSLQQINFFKYCVNKLNIKFFVGAIFQDKDKHNNSKRMFLLS